MSENTHPVLGGAEDSEWLSQASGETPDGGLELARTPEGLSLEGTSRVYTPRRQSPPQVYTPRRMRLRYG